jgi:hypothetical protein
LTHNNDCVGIRCKKQGGPMMLLRQIVIALTVVICLLRPTPSLAETNEVRVIGSIGLHRETCQATRDRESEGDLQCGHERRRDE